MSTFDFKNDPNITTSRNHKYSLRHRRQRKEANVQQQTSPLIHLDSKMLSAQSGQKEIKPQLSILASTFSQDTGFNCIQNAQNILSFNQATSVNVFRGEDNGNLSASSFALFKIASQSTLINHPQLLFDDTVQRQKSEIKSSNGSKSISKQQKKIKYLNQYKGNIEVITKKNGKNKLSLRKSHIPLNSYSQLRVCLSFSDIKYPLHSLTSEQLRQMFQNRQNLHIRPSQSRITKFLCSNFIRLDNQGCRCDPKCLWINRWLARAEFEELKIAQISSYQSSQAILSQIQKDIPRTQPTKSTFQIKTYKQHLKEVLIEYSKIDPEIGYVQGMNIVASIVVYHSSSSYEALKVFELLMYQMGLRKIYQGDLSFCKKLAASLLIDLRRIAFDLYSYFTAVGIDITMFVTSWYFSIMGSFVPLQSMHGIVEKFMRRGWTGINEVIIAFLLLLKQQIFDQEEEQLLEFLSCRELQARSEAIDWMQLIARSDNILLPLSL